MSSDSGAGLQLSDWFGEMLSPLRRCLATPYTAVRQSTGAPGNGIRLEVAAQPLTNRPSLPRSMRSNRPITIHNAAQPATGSSPAFEPLGLWASPGTARLPLIHDPHVRHDLTAILSRFSIDCNSIHLDCTVAHVARDL